MSRLIDLFTDDGTTPPVAPIPRACLNCPHTWHSDQPEHEDCPECGHPGEPLDNNGEQHMSYDTYLLPENTGKPCPACGHEIEGVQIDLGNITSNVGDMYRAAMPGPYEGGGKYAGTGYTGPRGGLPGLSGLRCSEAYPILFAGVQYMEKHEAELRELEPSNGWGSYEGALDYLRAITVATLANPGMILGVDW